MNISLIANSGIQFHKFDLVINPNDDDVMPTQGFFEDLKPTGITTEYARYLPDDDIWITKAVYEHHVNSDGEYNLQEIKGLALSEDDEYYTLSDVLDSLEIFASQEGEHIWLPVPYFRQNDVGKTMRGPFAWARMMLKQTSGKKDKVKKYRVVLAFDTKIDENDTQDNALKSPDKNKVFGLCNNEDYLLNFLDNAYGGEWIFSYTQGIYLKREGKTMDDLHNDFPQLKYVGLFVYLLKYLEATRKFPEVVVHDDNQAAVDVDLVLDIGNANTCGLLFESPSENNASTFNFNSVEKLKLQNLSNPEKEYQDPFSMRLAFVETRFDAMFQIENEDYEDSRGDRFVTTFQEMKSDYRNFIWPSLLRLGQEASQIISKHNLDKEKGKETANHYSSPKRYLWDDSPFSLSWEFVNLYGQTESRDVSLVEITTQFKSDGSYAYDGNFGSTPNYSRKSLMTFVYIEILAHAFSQINSFEFRYRHGNPERPRKLRRITITCPTSIIQKEQVVLRKCAEEALITLDRFFNSEEHNPEDKPDIKIIPAPKELGKNLSMAKERKDWIYDEATCGQLVFLYAEISQRYLNKANIFFDIYGKKRDDLGEEPGTEENAITIGSIDIGGGTTDLMICSYQYAKGQSQAVIKPFPLYWESFSLAGDDLLKEVVQQIILEGTSKKPEEYGAIGVIENAAIKAGVEDVAKKMLNFFGPDSNKQGYMARMYRKNFIVQVAVPIALRYLEHASEGKANEVVGFEELFPTTPPNQDLLNYFNTHFAPLKFEDIRWNLSKERVYSILETTFDPLLKQISVIMSAYGCDFVLLAGKPTTLPKIREMFIKYYPVSPERIITLNNYRVGSWYPFADELGYFEDPKTMVSVGALIALMGGKIDKLDGFRLNTTLLKRHLISTSDYIGLLDKYTQNIDEIFLTPDEHSYEAEIHSLPMVLGYKQLPNTNYKGRPMYKLDFNNEAILQKILERQPELGNQPNELSEAIEEYKNNIKNRMPLKVKLKRNRSESKEKIEIDRIKDIKRNELSKRFLSASIMTLPEEKGYWLDTGEFILNIK